MHCHSLAETGVVPRGGSIALVGHPNVGKSVLFQRLTGQHATVSNYPGTTVEITRGSAKFLPDMVVIDTPGVITFPPHSEDEQVTGRVLFDESLRAIIQVGDAKNLRRTLLLTVQLAEMGLPMVVALNMMDEADSRGVIVDHQRLSESLVLPVVPTTATRGRGVDELAKALRSVQPSPLRLDYPAEIEAAVAEFCGILADENLQEIPISPRALALMWLSGDPVSDEWLSKRIPGNALRELALRRGAFPAQIQRARLGFVQSVSSAAILESGSGWRGISLTLGRFTTHPFWGLLILGLVLYSMYWFVGVWGAGTLVGLLEENLFGEVLNPWMAAQIQRWVRIPFLVDFLVGEYGIWTMGMTYALALILPIVTTFFLAFGFMEDSGYLPRLAALTNRVFQFLGLNGKAVLPMVLGLGCVTMATLTTRVLESKRERVLVTLLLALAVPCSAQLGVVMGMLAGISLGATLLWSGVVLIVLLAVGWLAARMMPGERSLLIVELPPLRWPMFSNVVLKTLARLEWYIKEVVPLFLVGTALMFGLDKLGVLSWLIRLGEPLVTGWLGLPAETSAAFLMGFLRRDFGATGLFVMQSQGLLSPVQVVVAMVTITLFIPCVASIMVIAKERDWRTAAGMMALIFPLAFLVGGLLNRILTAFGW